MIKLVNAWNEGRDIVLLTKENGQKKTMKITNFDWYFFVKLADYNKMGNQFWNALLKRENHGYIKKVVPDGEYVKIYVDNINIPFDSDYPDDKIKLLRVLELNKVQTYDADIQSYKRWMLDRNDIEIDDNLDVKFIDIETDDSTGEIVIGREKIFSFAAYDMAGNQYYVCEDNERDTLLKIKEILEHTDIICGWNSKNFDLPYIQVRFAKNGIPFNWKMIQHFDLMWRFIKLFAYNAQLTSFSLNNVAKAFLGEEKLKIDKKMWELFANDRETLKKYNMRDVELLWKLENKMNSVSTALLECKICKSFLSRFYIAELLDNYILREATGVKWPTPIEHTESLPYVGAFVLDPEVGLYEDVYCFDFKSLYPSIIKTLNISIESNIDKKEGEALGTNTIKTINGVYFKKDVGAIPRIIEKLLDERSKLKKQLKTVKPGSIEYNALYASQAVIKELGNSMYGILGYRRGRYFKLEFAEAITLTGQFAIKESTKYLQAKYNADVLYGDTDSLFVKFKTKMSNEEVENIRQEIDDNIGKLMKSEFNAEKSHLTIEFEKHYKTLLLLDKKKYIGLVDWQDDQPQDKIHGRGVEVIKKDTIEYARTLQKELIDNLLRNMPPKQDIEQWAAIQKKKYIETELTKDDLIINIRISKPLDTYKNPELIHVKIARQMTKNNQPFFLGMSVPFIVTSCSPRLDGIYAEDFKGEYDKKYYWNNRIWPMLARLLYVTYPKSNWSRFYINERDANSFEGQKNLSEFC